MVLVAPQVRHRNRPVLPIAMDMAVRPALLASDASAGLDVVRPAADLPHPCRGAVRGFRQLASVDAQESKVAHPRQERRKPPQDGLPPVAYAYLFQSLVRDVASEFRLDVAPELP
jgi:hypothetical protein